MRPAGAALLALCASVVPARARAEPPPDPVYRLYDRYNDSVEEIVRVWRLRGRFSDAARLLEPGIGLAREQKDPRREARLKAGLGRTLTEEAADRNSGFDPALGVLLDAKDLAEASGDRRTLGQCLDLIGVNHYLRRSYQGEGSYDTAYQSLEQALGARIALDDERGIAETLLHIGPLLELREAAAKARDGYRQARAIAERIGDRELIAEALVRLAPFEEQGRGLAGVLDYHERALRLREELQDWPGSVESALAVGRVQERRSAWDAARRAFQRALDVSREADLRRGVTAAHLGLADVSSAHGDVEERLAHGHDALLAAEELGDRDGATLAALALADAYEKAGDAERARTYRQRAAR